MFEARLIIKLLQVSYSLSTYLFFWKSLTRKVRFYVFRQQIKARFIKKKSVILCGIIHGLAFMPAPQLTASTAQVNMRVAWASFYTEVKRWLWTIFALIVAVTQE